MKNIITNLLKSKLDETVEFGTSEVVKQYKFGRFFVKSGIVLSLGLFVSVIALIITLIVKII
jgi:hypothetical protein